MRICLRVMYDGTNYFGFQKQQNDVTIQGLIEEVLKEVNHIEIPTIGASRTDSGVHALDNILVFDTDRNYDPQKWMDIINSKLPRDIRIYRSYRVKDDFHPLASSLIKTYQYRICNEKIYNPLDYNYIWHIPKKLDYGLLEASSELFIGSHDFYNFKNGNKEYKTTIRKIFASTINYNKKNIIYTVTGDGFMYNMVRKMVGAMVDIATNKVTISQLRDALERESNYNPQTAPAKGLTLVRIDTNNEEMYVG